MSEGTVEGQDNVEGTEGSETQGLDQGTETSTGINPAWNELLEALPSSLHSQITPHLTKWDQNFQSEIGKVQSQYAPYQPFIEQQVQPDQIEYALGIMAAIDERPQEVLQALQAYIGEEDTGGQGLEDTGNGPEGEQPEWLTHPEFLKTQEMVNTMAQILVQQRESEQNSQIDSELDAEVNSAREKYGDFDEEWVYTKALAQNLSIEEAVQAYKEFENGILQRNSQPGPPVLGPGGSVPNQSFDPTKLDGKDRRKTVAEMLAQAAQHNQ